MVSVLPSARHVPGKVVGWEPQVNKSFQAGLTAEQAPQKVHGLANMSSVWHPMAPRHVYAWPRGMLAVCFECRAL
eukprot:8818632-Heterocapsa_arctica.AAC.1